jgi:hypothetical protein
MSLMMTRPVGSRNQMMPSNRLLTKKEVGMKMTCAPAHTDVITTRPNTRPTST